MAKDEGCSLKAAVPCLFENTCFLVLSKAAVHATRALCLQSGRVHPPPTSR